MRNSRKINKEKINLSLTNTVLTVDTSGCVIVDGPNKFLNFDNKYISLYSKGKRIYIYGEYLVITAYSKNYISIDGNVTKIELFGVGNETENKI